jgi:DNA repair protein RadC
MTNGKTIKDLPKIQRPRERLDVLGISNLTEPELLAIILTSGTKKKNVLTVAKQLLREFPLDALLTASLGDLSKVDGIGKVKAGKIMAGIELGKRALVATSLHVVLTPKEVLHEVKDIENLKQEHLIALYLNARHELLQKQTISVGSLNQAIIEPRDIFSYALLLPSPFIILVHNHPSGDPTASEADIKFTKRLVEAGNLLGIKIIDHIIVTAKDYSSFKEANVL